MKTIKSILFVIVIFYYIILGIEIYSGNLFITMYIVRFLTRVGAYIFFPIIVIFIFLFILSVVLAWCGTTIPRVFRMMMEDIKKGEGNKNG